MIHALHVPIDEEWTWIGCCCDTQKTKRVCTLAHPPGFQDYFGLGIMVKEIGCRSSRGKIFSKLDAAYVLLLVATVGDQLDRDRAMVKVHLGSLAFENG